VLSTLHDVARAQANEEAAAAEQACVAHYQEKHQLRYALWKRLGWRHLMTWPTRSFDLLPEDESFEPIAFMIRGEPEIGYVRPTPDPTNKFDLFKRIFKQ
jgi:hypothetical protein